MMFEKPAGKKPKFPLHKAERTFESTSHKSKGSGWRAQADQEFKAMSWSNELEPFQLKAKR